MKIIIAGSRNLTSFKLVKDSMGHVIKELGWIPSLIISGTATGVDKNGEIWAKLNEIPILRMPAKWREFGKGAGFKRNEEMAANADALVAIWNGSSNGTAHMIECAKSYNLKIYINKITPDETNARSQVP